NGFRLHSGCTKPRPLPRYRSAEGGPPRDARLVSVAWTGPSGPCPARAVSPRSGWVLPEVFRSLHAVLEPWICLGDVSDGLDRLYPCPDIQSIVLIIVDRWPGPHLGGRLF